MPALRFEIERCCTSSQARVGKVHTPHGSFATPAFMPVGTRGSVKGLLPRLIAETGSEILLNNTYHLLLRPGADTIARLGGVHRFMSWNRPILTDSGGYQAFSMADINAIDDEGVTFKSIIDGSDVRLTPAQAIEAQNKLGADIIMAFDDCPPAVDPKSFSRTVQRLTGQAQRGRRRDYDHGKRLDEANERTIRWLELCRRAHRRSDEQALFGIVQGGADEGRRTWSAERVCNVDLPGYAIGGVAVGEGSEQIEAIVRHTAPLLPDDKPRYLMGVGYERDIVAAVSAGVDMFDCVLPTRNGRNANAFTRTGQMRLRNSQFADDPRPIEPGCDCHACDPVRHGWDGEAYSRAYLRHLFQNREMLGPILVSLHNLRHFQRLMLDIRRAIHDDTWPVLADRWPVLRQSKTGEGVCGEAWAE